jgi:hypothetical protein
LQFDIAVTDPLLPNPTSLAHNLSRDHLHVYGDHHNCDGASASFLHTTSFSNSSPPHALPTSALPKQTFSIMTHVRNTSDPKRHTPIVQAYKKQRRELEAVYGAAQAAQKALKLAQGQLSRLQDQIDQIPGQSPAATSTDAHPSMTLIHLLGKLSIEKRLDHCGDSAAQNQTTADIGDMEPADQRVYQRAAAKNEQPLKGPSTMRMNLVEAEPQISQVSQLRAEYLSKTLRYKKLQLSCKRMEAGMVQWAFQQRQDCRILPL